MIFFGGEFFFKFLVIFGRKNGLILFFSTKNHHICKQEKIVKKKKKKLSQCLRSWFKVHFRWLLYHYYKQHLNGHPLSTCDPICFFFFLDTFLLPQNYNLTYHFCHGLMQLGTTPPPFSMIFHFSLEHLVMHFMVLFDCGFLFITGKWTWP